MARIISYLNPWSDPLGSGFQIIVRCVAAYLLGIKLLVFQGEANFQEIGEREAFRVFLDQFKKKQGIGLLISSKREQLEEWTDIIYEVT